MSLEFRRAGHVDFTLAVFVGVVPKTVVAIPVVDRGGDFGRSLLSSNERGTTESVHEPGESLDSGFA